MSSCVIKNKDFYSLAEEHGVDGSELELIVHKYWNEVGKEDSFPPSSYINEQLGIGKIYDETSENVRKLWDRDYSRPIKFKSEYELNGAVEKAKSFFPADAVVTYKDNNGNFVLRIAEPITSSSINKEMQDILAKASRDSQGRLLAPNGNISNLAKNEKQYAQVRTKAFKKWFGDWTKITFNENGVPIIPDDVSKVVDENGEPLVVYHGTPNKWNIANINKAGSITDEGYYGKGLYLSSLKNKAKEYNRDGNGMTLSLFVNIKNPFYAGLDEHLNIDESSRRGEIVNLFNRDNEPIELKQYDGVLYTGGDAKYEEIVIKTSNQIKSATDNIGTFSTIDDHIQHDITADNTTSSSSISYVGQETATTRVQSFIDSINKSGEYGQAIQEFIDTFGIPVVNEVIFNITQANTHNSSWNNFTRALKLGFSEMASSEEKAAVTLHELIHSRTTSLANLYERAHGVKSLKSKEKSKVFEPLPSDSLTPEIEKAFDNIVECKAEVLKYLEENPEIKEDLLSTDVTTNLNKPPLYAILKETNKYKVKEFISEIYTNPAFIQLLKSIPTKVEKQSLWTKIVNALKSIFGNKKSFVSVLDRARENADIIVRAGNNVNTSFETISEDASSLPIGQQRAQLINYYASLQTRTSQEFKQVRSLASQFFKNKHTFTSREAAKAIADKYIRDNHIDSDMIDHTYGYKVPNQQFFVPAISWKKDFEYANAKYVSAREYVNSFTNGEVESEILRLFADEEMFDSTFTFKDGTTIDTPFELNDQQKIALQKIDDFANDKSKTAITLSGYAGTGKTSLMEMVAQKLRRRHNVVFSATTHQAAGVLKSKVGKYGFDTRTVNSLFGIAIATDMEGTRYDASKKVRIEADDKLGYGDVVIIDEASMLSDENYNDVVSLAKMKNAKVIFVGDKAQLAPVGQAEVSKVFRDSNGEVVELTKVERTGDNAILSEATAIRNGQNFTYESAFNAQGQGVAYVTPQSTDVISSIIETFTPGLKTNPNYLRILAFTNASVANYNSKVRQSLGYNGLTPQVGEPMLGYANWGYDRSRAASGDPYKFVNSRSYKVVATQAPYKNGVRLSDGTICSFDILPLKLEDSMGEQVTVPFIDIKNNVQNRNSAKLAAQEKAILWTKWRTAQGMQKRILLDSINELENFLFINDNLTGDQNTLLQAKVIDFGYAHTIHKSQGGTYTHVIMDDGGIDGSRSSAEMKQQLKYVGVSRATDTVTIISPQTKKADSPVNHMQVGPEEVNNSNIAPTRPQNTQTESINIFAGTRENAHLSNFAERPFTHTWGNGKSTKFYSVEQAFQFAKAMMFKDREAATTILAQTKGSKIKSEGRKVKGYNDAQWKQHRAAFMKAFIKESFMQNPKALEQLLATGNATLTHTQDRSAWGQTFPQILMQVREELRNYTPTKSSLVDSVVEQFGGYFEGGSADIMHDYPGLSKEIVDKLEDHIMSDGKFTEADAKRFLEEAKNKPSTEQAPSTSTPLQDPRVSLAEHTPSQQASTDMLPPVSPINTTTPVNQIPAPNPEGPLKGFTLHSGGAIGADFAWGNIGASYGVTGKHYFDATDAREGKKPPYSNTPITDEDRTLGERKAFYAGKTMGRLGSRAQKVADPLLIRDWNQVKNSDMVVAIAQKFDMPGDKFSNKSDDDRVALVPQVSGGTGWAVQMAISEGIPVFIFSQEDKTWRLIDNFGVWHYSEAPVLSMNFTGIGTRGLNADGEAAIRECYEKTVAAIKNQSVRPTVEETVEQAKKPFDINSLPENIREDYKRQIARDQQINNILSSGVMTSIEAREIVDSLMNLITDYITEIINDPAINDVALKEQGNDAYLANLLVNKNFEGLIAPFNPKGLTRLEIINKIGIDNLVNVFLKSKLTATATVTRAQAKKMRVLSQNLDAILYLGANTLSINEGIHLTTTRVNGKELKTVENDIVINPDINSASNTESIQENEGLLQEKWQIDSRTIDPVESMSQLVRNELFKLYQLDSNGNKITDGIGIYKRVPVQETTKQLLNWLQGCLTLKDVVARLKDKQTENPWVKQLIDVLDVEALGDNAGQHTDFQNSFFSVFNKHFQSYSATTITYDKDGVQHIKRIPLNEKPFLKETLGQIKVDIASGIHPLFTANNGVNQLAFENFKTVLDTLHTIRDTKIAKIGFDKMSGADRQLAFEAISQAASLLGYPTDATTLGNLLNGREIREMITYLDNMYDDILANVNNPTYEPLTFTKGEGGKKGSGIRGSLSKFLEPLTKHLADIAVSTTFDSGKMYQSHVTPSYMTKLMLKFHETDPIKFNKFIQEEFGKYDWFRNTSIKDTKAGWRSGWIGLLARDPAARKVFKHEAKLNYNKHNYMKDMTGNEYIMSLLSSFFSEGAGNGRDGAIAWYRIPILSNKPSEEYIRFYADMGQDYKEVISTKMAKVFNQELSRIQTVRMQNYDKSNPRFIKNFHENGKKFCFLDFMNEYLEGGDMANTELGKLLRAKLEGTNWDVANEPRLLDLAKEAIQANMQARITEILKNYETRGIMEIAENIDGIKQGFGKDNIAENIERFLWNDTYATTQILQLTVTDIAYYKDIEDLQKRIAQIHAPGIRGNAEAVDYEGNRVSDGLERTMYLTDFSGVKSNIIDNVKIVFDRKLEELRNQPLENFSTTKLKTDEDIQRATEAKQHRIMVQEELYNNILKQFEDINVADAQGYSSPTSYRKKMFIFGKWSKEAENIYQKLITGNYNYHDLQVAFQPLKPFVYSQIEKPTYLEKGPLKSLKMPVQNKNSEYLLIMADAILQGENTGQPNLLRAIYEVMEESAKASPTNGIDTIQFESTVKSGLMGRNDINRVLGGGKWNELIETKDPNTGKTVQRTRGEVAAKAYLQNNLYIKNANGVVTGYNPTFVHEIPFEDYCIQQEVPEHFKDHAQQHGSQIRMITPSDLLSIDTYGNPVTYNVEGKEVSAKEFREEYEQTIADNIQQSINEVFRELHLDTANQVEKNIVLSRMLQDEILSSPRYGLDMYLACSLNPITGEFRIPLGDPIQANRIEQLLNSIVKKKVNEQKIAGGPVVQVSNFGTSRRLNIRFKDKNGGLLKTRDEFTKNWKPVESTGKIDVKSLANKLMKEEKLSYTTALKEAKRRIEESQNTPKQTADEAYEKYIRDNQGGIAYFEVFAPIFNEEIFTRFADPDGTIDIATMEKVCPEALQMIGYRIPTEDKYSCAPIKIVGFLPREAGEGIMLPYDITLLTGSDFDVDKEYLMRKQIHVNLKPFKEQYEALKPLFLAEKRKESKLSREFTPQELKQFKSELSDMIDMFRSNDRTRSYIREAGTNPIEKKMWQKFKEVGYNIVKATKDKEYRDNKIFDMTWEVLSHETTADKMLNPGGFEEQKKMAYLIEAYRNSDKTWEELQSMKTDDLKKLSYSTKNLIFLDSQVQFYEQNNAASTILGMFAVQKIGHAVLESNGYQIDVEEACDIAEPFTILGKKFGGRMEFDPMIDDKGNVIGKTLGSHVAAAADAAKEPCMNLLNINSMTANVHSTLIRLGMPFRHASLFLAQPVIRELLDRYNKRNLTDFASLDTILNEYIQEFREEGNMADSSIEHEEITEEELIDNLRANKPETNYKVATAFGKLQRLAYAIKGPTYLTRYNSISNAVGPLITDNIVTEFKTNYETTGLYDKHGNELTPEIVFADHPVLRKFADAYEVANKIFEDFPTKSKAFSEVLESIPGSLQDKFLNDRVLLNDLKDFFLSHILVDNRVVNENRAGYYIKEFAGEFIANGIKEKNLDNEFIQAIKVKQDKDTGEFSLELSTTGMDQQKKDRLSTSWYELYKKNQPLAIDLFNYCFFKGGIGFNPKTFMNLLPLQMRESIQGYKESFTNIPTESAKYILEQFLAHNTSNHKLFPVKEGEKDVIGGGIIIQDKNELSQYADTPAFRIKDSNNRWRYLLLDKATEDALAYKEIIPLGDNGEYLEMSSTRVPNISIKEIYGTNRRSKKQEAPKQSEVTNHANRPIDDTNRGLVTPTPAQEKSKAERLIKGIMESELGMRTPELAKKYLTSNTIINADNKIEISNPTVWKYISAAMESQGLTANKEELKNILEQLC